MNWLNKLERKFGRYAVHNLTTYLIGTYIIGYAIRLFIPDMMIWLYLQPGAILHGQIWRIVSWILVPPQGSLLEIVIMLMLYYSLGTTLERTWEHSAIMYISFRVFYLRYWERLCCTSCMARGQISWVDISVRIISTSQFFLHLLQAIRIWNFCCISSFRSRSSGWDWCMEYTSCTSWQPAIPHRA